ncbi:biosynthetic-type acetolactate synthase large subunit [Desulfurella multipotens]|uniref:biosynthetic-type acetolactate synthase large subunit n=1 Tax=Desulfurella TaxID=33001 RepID=UPI000CB966A2|nr:biosynthetic-type acetolactate synthase large subunit [Desulfurella multipotens]PMP64031.1 MAG: acetolactate synthase, large subunit, biosynthetic type [Desulfurella multipotens]
MIGKLKGAEIFIECLKKEGVKHLFGIPGGAIIDLHDAIYKQKDIEFILTRHEQGAVHMADGYARSTGQVGVSLVTSGPGATNAVTGIATAYMDSIPLVVFTGQVPTHLIGNDAFQEVDIVGITRSCTKHNFLVKDVKDLAYTIKKAFYIAKTGRPGPVLVDIPKDVQTASCEFEYPDAIHLRSYNPTYHGNPKQIKKVAKVIEQAERPLLYIGGGVITSNAHKEVLELAERLQIPAFTTLMGIGAFPADHPLSLGMAGMHGTYKANMAIQYCDLLISIGARFDDRITGKVSEFAPNAQVVHIDIDPTSISKNIKVDYPIVGDAKLVLKELLSILKDNNKIHQNRKKWLDLIKKWDSEHPLSYEDSDKVIKPQYVIQLLNKLTKELDPIVSTEVGQHQMWVAQFYNFNKPKRFLTSGGLGTMGFGFPAGIGASFANPDKQVFVIAGDGSFQMNLQELAVLATYKLQTKVIILNNSYLGMVRQWQQLFYGRRYANTNIEVQPDFVKLSESYGITAKRVEDKKDVEHALTELINYNGPYVLDIKIEREENVYPMVPGGAPLSEMILT